MVSLSSTPLYCYRFLASHYTNRVPEKAIFRLVTVYNTNISRQCKLTIQIESMQDKIIYSWKRNGKRTITSMGHHTKTKT